ncbi:hypothetical protein [Nocardia concava]|uniref:hypothetical protein n=1 Tax=Nocardia concava TaxID=257281 RepID=UPI000593C9E8|nr:hypothetical protein [Nocardia concava]
MARYENRDDIAERALAICYDVRDPDVGAQFHYSQLAHACQADPERMAQILLCLATWVPVEQGREALADRAQSVVDARVELLEWRVSA